ncbi:glucose-1-phosphate cytidylyltransferase [Planktomarina temperata]|nr:glucose-1-phosphate cytidylyltransferase [Planktomarina temperata]
MKVVIFAGGLGTRLSEETHAIPKPMVEIGEMPIIWHIMKIYSQYGFRDFLICGGYKAFEIKKFFAQQKLYESDVKIETKAGNITYLGSSNEDWTITISDTGLETQTGGRLRRIKKYLSPNEDFFLTYGDGLADINIAKLLEAHKKSGKLATVTAVKQPSRFGILKLCENQVTEFVEKPIDDGLRINAGFFVINPKVIDMISSDSMPFESDPLRKLAEDNQLNAYLHNGFWKPMDTLKDKNDLTEIWNNGDPRWKIWD